MLLGMGDTADSSVPLFQAWKGFSGDPVALLGSTAV